MSRWQETVEEDNAKLRKPDRITIYSVGNLPHTPRPEEAHNSAPGKGLTATQRHDGYSGSLG
jgi:hypothetical protein